MPDKENYSVIKIKDELGNVRECDVLYLFSPKNSDMNYIVYTDNTVDESGAKRIFAHKFNKKNDKDLLPLESEEEWYTVEAILTKLEEKNKEG